MQLKTKRLETLRKPTSSKPPISHNNNQLTPIQNEIQNQIENPIQNHPFFPFGSVVEVTSDEEGFKGAWFLATVLKPPPSSNNNNNNKVFVEYNNLLAEENGSTLLTEFVDVKFVRPRPPIDEVNDVSYKVNDVVDAYYQDGWWCGVVTQVVHPNSNYSVFFSNPPDEQIFGLSDLRVHKSWVRGNWVVRQNKKMGELIFSPGTAVEVNIDPDFSPDVWFPATLVKLLSDSSFLVEYQNSSGAGLQKVAVKAHHIRPSPPVKSIKTFSLLEKVDALFDCCWLSGLVTKILADGRYIVYFKRTKKEKELPHSDLRLHMDWINGKWVYSSQDKSIKSNVDKRSGSSNGGYKEKIHASSDSGLIKGNVGQSQISAVTQTSSLNNSQTPGSGKVDCTSVTPSNKRTKQTGTNSDIISLRLSGSSNEEVASDVLLSPASSQPQVKQTEVLDSGTVVDLDISTPVDQGKSCLKQSEDHSLPSDYTDMKDSAKRKRGRPSKLPASVTGFLADPIEKTPTYSNSVTSLAPIVVGLTYNGKMIDSLASSSGQLLNVEQVAINKEGKYLATAADHHDSIGGGRQKEGEVTNLKRKRGRPPKILFRLGNPETKAAVPESVNSADKAKQVGIDVESSYESPLMNKVEKYVVPVEPPTTQDLILSADSGRKRMRLISKNFENLGNARKVGGRTAKRAVRKHKKVSIVAAMEPPNAFLLKGKKLRPNTLADIPFEDAGVKSVGPVTGDSVNVIGGGDIDKVFSVISVTASDDDRPLSAWLDGAHPALATCDSKLHSDEPGEKLDKNETLSSGQSKKQVAEENVDTSVGKDNGVPTSQDETQAQSTVIVPSELLTESVAIVPREGQGLPFVKNSPVWGMIESMDILQRIPQKPHFLPLFNCKEECREGIAIGTLVTFTSLAEKISKTCLDDPKSLLEGYLEALVDLEELGFNVMPLRELLNKLLTIKGKHEQTRNSTKDFESQIMVQNEAKSKIDDEIADLEKKMAELKGKHALAVSKKERKDGDIKLLQSSVDAIKGAFEKAREEFAKLATSLC